MTNGEKFEQVFGIRVDNGYSLCLMVKDCKDCIFYPRQNCSEHARLFWQQPYGRQIDDERGNENP